MAVKVDLEKNKVKKQGFVGFSWTTFFFGFFVPLFRGDVVWAIAMLAAGFVTAGLSNLVFCFIYNKKYTEKLLENGFEPVGDTDREALQKYGLYGK